MKAYLLFLIILLFGCSDNLSPDDETDDVLLIYQYVNSKGILIAGNDSLVPRLTVDGFGGFLFEHSDTSIFISEHNIIDIDEVKVIVITRHKVFSSTLDGNINFIYLNNKSNGEQIDSLFTNNSLKYKITYNYIDGSTHVFSPNGNSCFLTPGMTYEDSTTSIDSVSRSLFNSNEYVNLVYEYTHYQNVINYGFINRSKINIIK